MKREDVDGDDDQDDECCGGRPRKGNVSVLTGNGNANGLTANRKTILCERTDEAKRVEGRTLNMY